MPIAHITAIAYKSSFDSQYGGPDGKMHSHAVTFSDGISGTANTKTPVPYYKVGDEMAYTITEQNKFGYKLKIEKLGQGQARPAPSPANPSHSEPIGTPVKAITPVHGGTVGMCLKMAVDLLSTGKTPEQRVTWMLDPTTHTAIWEKTSDFVRIFQRLEAGDLAPTLRERSSGQTRPRPGPGGSVALNPDEDGDVPY